MKRKKNMGGRWLCMLLCAVMLTLSVAAPASAAESRTAIKKVSLRIKEKVTEDTSTSDDAMSFVEVSNTSAHYSIQDAEWVTNRDYWEPGDTPKLKVILAADNGYYFSSMGSSSSYSISGGGTFSTRSRKDDNETLEVTLKLSPVKGTLGETEDARWVAKTPGKALWDKVDYASAYELRLYRGSRSIKSVDKVTSNNYDFYDSLDREGYYTFWVRAIPKDAEEAKYLSKGEWVESEEFYVDEGGLPARAPGSSTNTPGNTPGTSSQQAGWQLDNNGWWYRQSNGSAVKNDWAFINNKWYLFDSSGYMLTGWQLKNNKYYYMSVNGDMMTGWLNYNRLWYYLGPNGDMQKGWLADKGKWYYLDTNGVMLTGWVKDAYNRWYYLDPNNGGAMATNTYVGGFYVNGDGVYIQ